MYKKIVLVVLAFFLTFVQAERLTYINQPKANIYFKAARLKLSSFPITIQNILYVPLRDVASGMLLELKYTSRQGIYEIKRAADFKTIVFKLNSTKIKINDRDDTLTYPVLLIKNQYYVPLADFLWALGYFVKQENNDYQIISKIKAIEWQEKTLFIRGEAPLDCKMEYLNNTYSIEVFNTILGGHEETIEVGDGNIDTITYRQASLSPARVKLTIKTARQVPYTAFQEDAENSFIIKFNYQSATVKITPTNVPPAEQPTAVETISAGANKLTTGIRQFSSNTVLWLPEKTLSTITLQDFVVNGRLYKGLETKSIGGVLYAGQAEVFTSIGCPAKDFPLVQTLRDLGYAAYFADNKIFINPRVAEMVYQSDAQSARLFLKAGGKLAPRKPLFLKNPQRCLIDIPNAAFDAPLNYLRPGDDHFLLVRGAQFDQGIVRIVFESGKDNKFSEPAVSYTDEGRTLVLTFGNAVKTITQQTVIKPVEIPLLKGVSVAVENVETIETSIPAPEVPIEQPRIYHELNGLKVAIIPGHGGEDAGAISRTGYMEKYPTLEVSKKLAQLLKEQGAIPYLCREDDTNVSLEGQAEYAIKVNADILISVHFNSFGDESVGGAETYYYKNVDYKLAEAVHKAIIKTTGVKNKGLKKAQMHNLNHTPMPGVLIEPLFISHRREETMCRSEVYQWKLAKAIVNGIEDYLGEK